MVRRAFLFVLLAPALVRASIWPEQFGAFKRTSAEPANVSEQKLWDEYGLEDAEQARYQSDGAEFQGTAYRFHDSTGAMAAFQWRRPADARPSKLGKVAAETANVAVLAYGNYLFIFEGRKPGVAQISALVQSAPKLEQSPLPVLASYLPAEHLVPNSERYITGPVALERFAPRIPASVAAFHLGSEAQLGIFRTANGEMKVAIFSYPTPSMARERLTEFEKLPGAMAKRSGPLVAVVISPSNADDAEKVLSQVRYQAAITWSQRVPTRRDNIGHLIINIFILIGILLCFFVVAGLAFGGVRILFTRGRADTVESMITLHLGDR